MFTPAATFTVKHELCSWLERQPRSKTAKMNVWRVPDGGRGEATRLSMEDLI